MTVRYEIRPLGPWTDPITTNRRSASTFRASWDDTLKLLMYEVDQLGGQLIIVQVDVAEADLRRDGMLRTHARVGFPGVRVAFDSRFGPLTYATDAFDQWYSGGLKGWQANVRAIALSLVALRAVDRYGVTRRGEQYTGWTAITARPTPMSPARAAGLLAEHGGGDPAPILTDPAARAAADKRAARRWHPDLAGGDADMMARLNEARDLLAGGGR